MPLDKASSNGGHGPPELEWPWETLTKIIRESALRNI